MKSALALELFGILLVATGITIELIMKADIGYILITTGSVTVATGAMLYSKVLRRKS